MIVIIKTEYDAFPREHISMATKILYKNVQKRVVNNSKKQEIT